jgi:predicted nucleic acid-binding protein
VKVLVDTSIWSLAFRRKKESDSLRHNIIIKELKELINETRAVIIGPIRQEILSGISDEKQYQTLKEKLKAFDDVIMNQLDFELAAELYNICRKKGIQGSHIDFLICAVALQNNFSVFTDDKDFDHYSKLLAVKLHRPRKLKH